MTTVLAPSTASRSLSRCTCRAASRCPWSRMSPSTCEPGECVVLGGPSGIGKSSILKMIYGNYRCDAGRIQFVTARRGGRHRGAEPRAHPQLRRHDDRLCQPVPACDPARASARYRSSSRARGRERGEHGAPAARREMLARLNVPERLWSLPPATFSGGEQQRVNIARGFVGRALRASARRADRIARRRQPGGRGGPHSRKEGGRRGFARHLPRRRCSRSSCRPDRRCRCFCGYRVRSRNDTTALEKSTSC